MSGVRLENTTLDMLGRARRVVVTEKETVFIDGRGNFDQIAGRVDHIRAEIEQSDSDFDREKLQERLAKIAGGVAVIKVGGRSEAELESRKVRIERAVRVALLAVMEGIATGGGVSLPFLASSPSAPALTGDEAAGAAIVAAALEAPLRQLAANAGFDPDQVVRSIQGKGSTFGLNVHTGRYGDLFAAGIIDAAAVLRIAIQSAVATTERYLMVA
jgi:chaperonin GroEL